jgi:DNA invertase Pin-like site-specific DNA recombinase
MVFGYARVSTNEQNLDLQIDALQKLGCEKIFQEKASGRKLDRPELEKLLAQIRSGDTLIVYSIDRLGRTVKQLIHLINDFKEQGINFKSITEGAFDTTTPMGEAVFQIMAILKGLEVSILRERTMKGLDAARARGRKGGRKPGSYNKVKAAAAATLYQKGGSVSEILTTLHISRATLYEYLKKEGVNYKGFTKKSKFISIKNKITK